MFISFLPQLLQHLDDSNVHPSSSQNITSPKVKSSPFQLLLFFFKINFFMIYIYKALICSLSQGGIHEVSGHGSLKLEVR